MGAGQTAGQTANLPQAKPKISGGLLPIRGPYNAVFDPERQGSCRGCVKLFVFPGSWLVNFLLACSARPRGTFHHVLKPAPCRRKTTATSPEDLSIGSYPAQRSHGSCSAAHQREPQRASWRFAPSRHCGANLRPHRQALLAVLWPRHAEPRRTPNTSSTKKCTTASAQKRSAPTRWRDSPRKIRACP